MHVPRLSGPLLTHVPRPSGPPPHMHVMRQVFLNPDPTHRNVTILGGGHATIDARSQDKVFVVDAGSSLTLNGVIIANSHDAAAAAVIPEMLLPDGRPDVLRQLLEPPVPPPPPEEYSYAKRTVSSDYYNFNI